MKVRVFLSSLALILGVFIVWLSLSASVQIASAEGVSATQKRLYFNKEVLPDHVFYPVLMALDRSRLEAAQPVEKIYLQVEYANRRLYYAQELVAQNKTSLAHTTLTKAEKYMLQAGRDGLTAEELPVEAKTFLLKALQIHHRETVRLKAQFSDSERVALDAILAEQSEIIEQLQS